MADTIREKIIQDAMTRVALILTANGYNTDIGVNAQRALKTQDNDVTQTVIVIPRLETTEGVIGSYGEDAHNFPLDVIGEITYDSDNENISAIGEQMYGDLIKSMVDQENLFSDHIDSVKLMGGGSFENPKNEERFAGAIATLEIKYKTNTGDPYSGVPS